ncbi:hypothetical protein SAMN04487917_101402 [Arthrobacter sp. yr096]|uniref:hypothetical protein n=1 Tax=Arthrobacter sp. yr096 TaxID=1761750 RepID=UPI0008C31F1D|nr:hypothetical protein [Arthrobacter sp. yr096]SEI45853.1 hypothetical protein SAMN04487917_101402 [Arthrobacter sp. yr096]
MSERGADFDAKKEAYEAAQDDLPTQAPIRYQLEGRDISRAEFSRTLDERNSVMRELDREERKRRG